MDFSFKNMDREKVMEECPICFEPNENSTTVHVHCCKQTMHLNCYYKCLPTCPMCRAEQPPVQHVTIVIKDWRRLFKVIATSIIACSCMSIIILQTQLCNVT